MDKVVVVSGGFDPVHKGHVRHIVAAEALGDRLVLILNSDKFLDEKKAKTGGKFYPDIDERREIVEWGLGVRFGRKSGVVDCVDADMTVTKTLVLVREIYPDNEIVFVQGGDRAGNVLIPESELTVCSKLGISLVYGVGGVKVQSSSWLTRSGG